MRVNTQPTLIERRTRRMATVFLIIFTLILTVVGYFSYRAEARKITETQYQILAAIGKLKSEQIQQWRKERSAEITRAANDALTIQSVQNSLAAPQNLNLKKQLEKSLQEELETTGSCETLIFDCNAKLLTSSDPDKAPPNDATRQAMREAVASNTPTFSDFFRASDGTVHIDLAEPVLDHDGKVLAVLVLRQVADYYLYPLIQSWLTPSNTAETTLLKREGDEVVFLNELRHRSGTALSLRRPLSDSKLPAARVVLGQTGIFLGKDYRGVDVICDLRAVAGSPWFIVTKVDEAEILAEVHAKALIIALIVGLFILLSAVLVAWYYRGRQTRIMGNLIEAEQRKTEALEAARNVGERHSTILLAAMDGFCLLDAQGRIQEVNAAYCRMSGYSEDELLTMGIADLDASQSPGQIAANVQNVFAKGSAIFESQHRRKDGSLFDVDISVQYHPSDVLMAVFIRDITARNQAGARIARLSMLYAALSECSKAIVTSKSAAELMPRICQTVVEKGGLKMAWIAMPDSASRMVLPVASFGVGTDYLAEIRISSDPADLFGRGPAANAIRDGVEVWINDYENEPSLAPWRDVSCRYGWKSCGVSPFRSRGKTAGALVVYSGIGGAFDEEVSALLLEMTDNISFALDHYAEEDERKQMENQLLKALDRAETGNRAKREFLTVMSHELRTPLNGILGAAEFLEGPLSDAEHKEWVEIITLSGNQLAKVVDDILMFSNVEKNNIKLESEPVFIADLVELSCKGISKAAADKGLAFHHEMAPGLPRHLIGDMSYISQILLNLLSNAVKFTQRGSVALRLAATASVGLNWLEFVVADTGVGIASEQLDRIFHPFTQADSSMHRIYEGTGLGLAISQQLAKAMGGSIDVSSILGEGSTFTFRLPIATELVN